MVRLKSSSARPKKLGGRCLQRLEASDFRGLRNSPVCQCFTMRRSRQKQPPVVGMAFPHDLDLFIEGKQQGHRNPLFLVPLINESPLTRILLCILDLKKLWRKSRRTGFRNLAILFQSLSSTTNPFNYWKRLMHLTVASLRTLGKKIAREKPRWILHWFYLRQEVLTVSPSGKYYEISILLSLQR